MILTAVPCMAIYAQSQLSSIPRKDALEAPLPLHEYDTVELCILGDMMMHTAQIERAEKKGNFDFSSYFHLIEQDIKSADIAIANMEFTLAGEPYSGYPSFSAPDEYASYLASCGFDVFLAANNHIMDKMSEGAERTADIYRKLGEELGIRFTGLADSDKALAESNPLILEIKGVRLAIVNYTYGTNLGADRHWPKTNYLNDISSLKESLQKAESADLTIVLPHWGEEYKLLHSPVQEEKARWMAENGADLIIGTHPHVIQDFEIIEVKEVFPPNRSKRVPIAYSLGNAVSNMSAENTQLGLMAKIRIVKESVRARVISMEFTYLWCSRPGGFNGDYTVVPASGYIERKEEWYGKWDYDKMAKTLGKVKKTTGIEEGTKYIYISER